MINCRHAWHNINAETDRTKTLYERVDEIGLQLEIYRLRFKNMLRRYL